MFYSNYIGIQQLLKVPSIISAEEDCASLDLFASTFLYCNA